MYLQKETHRQLKMELLQAAHRTGERPQDMSDLVEGLLQDWLKGRRNGQDSLSA